MSKWHWDNVQSTTWRIFAAPRLSWTSNVKTPAVCLPAKWHWDNVHCTTWRIFAAPRLSWTSNVIFNESPPEDSNKAFAPVPLNTVNIGRFWLSSPISSTKTHNKYPAPQTIERLNNQTLSSKPVSFLMQLVRFQYCFANKLLFIWRSYKCTGLFLNVTFKFWLDDHWNSN